jgi:serine/threonine protein kinase
MCEMLTANSNLSHYRIISKIGKGGMGEVYLAHDTKLNRRVALKVLPAELISNRERLYRLEQEARAASALNHPNIITIHEIGADADTHFIVTEFIEGETLRQRLQTARVGTADTLNIATQIAAALDAAHRGGIVHRDIKPENVMLRADGLVKVLDFGLAKLTEKQEGESSDSQTPTRALVMTNPGVVMGTVAYMSPEQARGLAVDVRTDVFSLGIMAYEMLAGRLPFAGATASDMMAAILTSEPAPLDETTPLELQRIIRKSLQKNVDERYQTAKDLLIDLKALKQGQDFTAELNRSGIPTKADQTVPTQDRSARTTSSAEYIASSVKQHKGIFTVALTILLLARSAWATCFTTAAQQLVHQSSLLPSFRSKTGAAT